MMMECLDDLNFAFLFPGQGSQGKGMGLDFYKCFSFVRVFYEQANDILGFNIRDCMFYGTSEQLSDTRITQPALFISSVIAYDVFKLFCKAVFNRRPISYCFGHSVGEYVALYASGVMDFSTGLRMVKRRSECMSECTVGVDGGMLALIGNITIDALQTHCEKISSQTHQACEIANINSDTQVIVSGVKSNLDILRRTIKECMPSIKAIPLNVSGAFHSSLMKDAMLSFKDSVSEFNFSVPKIPVIFNVNADVESRTEHIQDRLSSQINHRVLWHQSMLKAIENGVSVFVEFGHGRVLTKLCKSAFPSVASYHISDMASVDSFLNVLVKD